MKHIIQNIKTRKEKGQSLVEVALFFPIFLIILAGVIEVSHLAITQNRISNAARATARFGSNGGDNEGFSIVALNSVTQTLDLSEETWDLWAIRGKVNDDGNGFVEWEFTHMYGISNTKEYDSVNPEAIKQRVLDELNIDGSGGNAAGIKFVGSYILHDVDSIIGIDAIPGLLGYQSVRGFNVMRVIGNNFEQTVGCSAFPIAVHEGIRSVTPPGTGSNPYPPASLFDYPDNNPTPIPTYAQFFRNVPDTPLEDAQEGYVYKIQNGSGEGNFGWLVWNTGISPDSGTLGGSIGWPGDSLDYTDHNDGGQAVAAAYPWVVRGYVNPYDSTDISLHIGDFVPGSTGSINSTAVRDAMEPHVDKDRTLRLIIWSDTNNAGGNNVLYQVKRFGIFKLHGYHISQGQGGSWILAEFIRWDDSCGQQ